VNLLDVRAGDGAMARIRRTAPERPMVMIERAGPTRLLDLARKSGSNAPRGQT